MINEDLIIRVFEKPHSKFVSIYKYKKVKFRETY
jgi:hypothetical protein